MIKKTLCTLLAVLMLLAVLPVSVLAEDGAEDETLPAAEGTDEEVFALGTAAAESAEIIAEGICGDNASWTLYDDGHLAVTGSGEMNDRNIDMTSEQKKLVLTAEIGEGITVLGGLLAYCGNMTSVTLPLTLTTIRYNALYLCENLTDITIPAGVTSIGSHAFESCGFRALALPDSLESIGSGAFDYCSRMRALYIPAGVTAIPASSYANSPFITCSNLTIFCEAEAAPSGWGSCWNNMDPSKKVPVVFGCPKTVYEFWASLDPEAEAVVIPDGMTAIPAGIFKNFIRLKTVTIPASVTAVGENAFSGCSALTDVWFGGSAAQWSAISIAGGNTALTGAAMHNISTVASGTCGTNASWTLANDGVLTISGTGAMADFAPARRPEWESYKAQITSVVVEDGITSVGIYAFYNYAALQSVQLSGTVAKLCESAFYGCAGLKSFTAPAGLTEIGKYAFYACTGMGSVTLLAGLQTIDSYAFQSCKSLKSITIPAGVTTLGSYAFSNCDLLESVLLPDSITVIDTAVFNRCKSLKTMDLPVGVTTIKGNAFNGCTALTSITIPVTVTAFSGTASSVFAGSTNLKDIYYGGSQAQWNAVSNRPNVYWATMHYADFGKGDCGENVQWVLSGDGVLTISGTGAMTAYASAAAVPWNAFRSEIKSVVVESGVTSVSGHAFSDCGKLTSVSLPESVTAVGDAALADCGKLTAVTLPSGLSAIGAGAFRGSALTEITLPAAVTSVGEAAFADCSNLQTIRTAEKNTAFVSIDGVLYNGSMTVLLGCPAKKSGAITVPAGVTDIGGGAFAGCAGLTEITLPASVACVGADAFSGCSALRSVLYAGSETDRAAMNVNGDGNDILLSSIWHYDDAGHVYDRQVVSDEYKAAEADCTNPMTYFYSCACGEKGSTTFGVGEPLGHNFSEAWSRDAEYHWHAAICAHAQEISGKAAHTWGTPTEDGGTLEFTCTVCDAETRELAVNAVNFPDDGFRGAVAACDADGSGGLSAAEIAAVKTLDCRGLGISDLTGIEYLRELESLSLDGNNISSLDLRGCEKLSSVSFGQQSAEFTALPCGGSWQIDLGAIFGSGLSGVSVLPADGLDYDAGTGILTVGSDAPFTYTYDTGKGSMTVLASVTLSAGYPALIPGAAEGSVVEIDGISYAAGPDGAVMLPDGSSRLAVTFTYKMDSEDVHTQYPLGMTVYQLAFDGSAYTVEPVDVLCNVLQYAGSSIRITGNKGIRMITSVPDSARNALSSSGTAGMTLLEYGTLVAWDDELCGADLVFGLGYEKSAYAYKRDEADPVFKRANGLTQYTNVLVGFSSEQCVPDLAMRPYMILEDADGEQIILYGGTVHRSIGYIAWQNRNAFAPGNASYDYIWDIIHFVYGDAYDEDYKG